MKQIAQFIGWVTVGYLVATKAAPVLQAKLEAMDLDDMWEIFEGAEWE